MTSENPIPENNPTPDAGRESNKQPDHPHVEVSPAFAAPKLPPSHAHYQVTCKTEQNWWDKIKPFLEIAGVGLLGIYTAYTIKMYCANKKAANAAQSAAETAHDTLVVSERPWITVTVGLNGPGLTFNQDGSASLNLGIVIKNIGHSVASGINIRPEMFAMSFSANGMFNEPLDKQSSFCEKVRKEAIDPRRLFTLFPTEDTTANITVTLTKADIDSATMPFNKRDAKYVLPVIYGCVNYQFSFDKLTHQTQFIYELSQLNPVEPSHQFPIKIISGTIPLTNLVVRKYYFGGSLAD